MKLELSDFRKSTMDWIPAVNKDFLHRRIQGFFPALFKFYAGQSLNAERLYPLVMQRALTQLSGGTNTAPTAAMIGSPVGGMSIITVQQDLKVIGYESLTDLGQPGTPSNNAACDAVIFNSKNVAGTNYPCLVVSHGSAGGVYYRALGVADTWTLVSFAAACPRPLEAFQGKLYGFDSFNGVFNDIRVIKIVDTAWAVTTGLDLGGTYYGKSIMNVNNRYLAVVATLSNDTSSSATTLFIWNGQANNNPDYAIPIRGQYVASVVDQSGNYYVFAQQGTDTVAFLLSGYSLVEQGRLLNTTVMTNVFNVKMRAQVAGNYIVLTTANGLLFWNIAEGESFIAQYDPNGNVLVENYILMKNTSRWDFYNVKASGNEVFKYDYTITTSPTNANAVGIYETNFIEPVNENAQKIRAQIKRVDVYYKNPPPTTGDKIDLQFTYRDSQDGTYTTYNCTTLNSANSDTRRAFVENIGVECDVFSLLMNITVATSTWQPIIYKVVIEYVEAN